MKLNIVRTLADVTHDDDEEIDTTLKGMTTCWTRRPSSLPITDILEPNDSRE